MEMTKELPPLPQSNGKKAQTPQNGVLMDHLTFNSTNTEVIS